MADELHHKKHLRSIWSFYGHGFWKAIKESWEKYERVLVIFGFVYTVFAIGFCHSEISEEKPEGLDMSTWFGFIIPFALLILFLGYHLARAPYEIYKEQYENHAVEIEKKESEIKKLADEIVQLKATLCVSKNHTQTKDKLAEHLAKLERRILIINATKADEYEKNLYWDGETDRTVREIVIFLRNNLGKSEAALFISPALANEFAFPRPENPNLTLPGFKKQSVLSNLRVFSENLKEIIKSQR